VRDWFKLLLISALTGLAAAWIIATTRAPALAANSAASFADAVTLAGPAVVSVFADKVVTERNIKLIPDPMQRFLGVTPVGPERRRLERSRGSAVLVRSDGVMLTNNHVIAGYDNIRALLWDGRIARASVIGADPETDLAVLKIELSGLPIVKLADSSALRVGDQVLAIGNPYGYSQTVTSGIISALGRRDQNLSRFESFIQTDAAINEGNSGGALVNLAGELIGINTATLADAGFAVPGISFAIPANVAEKVLQEILLTGEVTRGWIGAEYGERLLPSGGSGEPTRLVYVRGVYQNSPAFLAGLLPDDDVIALDGAAIESAEQIRRLEATSAPGSQLSLSVRRAGLTLEIVVPTIKRPKAGN
jgi:serine protease DegQ